MELPRTLEETASNAEAPFYDSNHRPLRRGIYVRKDQIYYISGIEEDRFRASTAKYRCVTPIEGNTERNYADFARELTRLEDSNLKSLRHQVVFSA